MSNDQLKIVIYSYDGKAEFSAAITPVSVSHDPSEIILILPFWCRCGGT